MQDSLNFEYEEEIQPPPRSQNSIIIWASKIISYLFHPAFIPTIAVVVLYYLLPSLQSITKPQRFQWLGNIVLNATIFPLISTLIMKGLGFIKSLKMYGAKERIAPLLATMIFYFWVYHIFKNINTPLILRIYLLGNFIGLIAVFITNIFFKISMHTAAVGGFLGIFLIALLMQLMPFSLIILLAVGLIVASVGLARYFLNAHLTFELWLGYGVGLLAQLLAYYIL